MWHSQSPQDSSLPVCRSEKMNMWISRHLVVIWLHLLSFSEASPRYANGFFYQDVMNGNANGESRLFHTILLGLVERKEMSLPCF